MRVVLDTNLLVSAFLNPRGAPGEVVDMVMTGELELCVDDRILTEYAEVLCRPRLSLPTEEVNTLLAGIRDTAVWVPSAPLRVTLPDMADAPFLEVAIAADAILVTGNARHFLHEARRGVKVVSPREFLDWYHSLESDLT